MGRGRSLLEVSEALQPMCRRTVTFSMPLLSGNCLSFLSKRKAHRSTSGIGMLGYWDSEGMMSSVVYWSGRCEM